MNKFKYYELHSLEQVQIKLCNGDDEVKEAVSKLNDKKCETSFEKVIDVAFHLFLENGYDETTIRRIIDEAGMHIGSLYYIFPNKESILKALMITIYDMIHKKAQTLQTDINNLATLLYPTASILYMSNKSDKISRLFYKAYSTWSVFDELLKFSRSWALNYNFSPSVDNREYNARLLFIFGGLGNMVGELYHTGRKADYREKLDQFIDVSCRIFGVETPENIQETKNLLYNMLETEKITILGKEIDIE